MTIWTRLGSWRGRTRARRDHDLDREIRAHLELEAEESGMRDARRAFGSVARAQEDVRATWGWARTGQVLRDIRYGLRQLRRNPTFSVVAIITLALGIGANAAMFSAVDAILIRPLPYGEPERLVMVWDDLSRTGDPKFYTTPPEWREWRRHNTVFSDIAASMPTDVALSNHGDPEQLPALKVTGNFWSVLDRAPLVGRTFTEEEDVQGARVVVISHGLWLRRFGASPDVLGRTITLNDDAYEVIGVMPRAFYFMPLRDVDVWLPMTFTPNLVNNWGFHALHSVARMKAGVTLAQAQADMKAVGLQISSGRRHPRAAVVTPLREELTGKTSASLVALFGATGAILIIACVNLANLLMSRGVARHREVTLRAALGAGRRRLIAQFLTESLVLAGLGALAGLALAVPFMRFLQAMVPDTMAAVQLALDWRVLTFSTVMALFAGVVFGLVPALGGSRVALQAGLRHGGRGSAGGPSYRFQHTLIVVETALALGLMTTSGLLLQTFQQLQRVDLGIEREQLLTFVTPLLRYPEFDRRVSFVEEQLERIRAIPGVVNAAAISRVPLTVTDQSTFYRLEGQVQEGTTEQIALSRVVTRDYFSTVGARLREGRFFEISDRRSDAPAAIVNESFADRHFAGRPALGVHLKFGSLGESGYWYTVVGVVRDIRERGVAEEVRPAIYRVHEQANQSGDQPSGIVVRTAVSPASIVPAVRRAIWAVDPNQPVTRVQTMEDIVAHQLSVPTQNATLLSGFALVALLLASVGLYGVLAYAVVQRRQEIGVRMALGATSRDILLAFSRRGLTLTLIGVGFGLVLVVVSARLMRSLFYDVQPDYVMAFAIGSIVLVTVAGVACVIPARRASRVPPVVALQQE